jgi:hypothetical protein
VAAAVLALGGCSGRTAAPIPPASPIRFRDVTLESGIAWERVNGAFGEKWLPETMGGGGAFLDYDADGWLDVLLLNGDYWPGHAPTGKPRPLPALYRNRNGRFEDVTRTAGLAAPMQAMGAAVADYDADGFPDLLVTGVGGLHLFHNVAAGGGRAFRDVTRESGLRDDGWSTSAAWLDYDGDLDLDLFVCHYVKWSPQLELECGTVVRTYCRPQEYTGDTCRLFRNLGGGRFADVSRAAGVAAPNAKALGVTVVDLDGSGRPSLVVANDTEPNFLFRNLGGGRLEETGVPSGVAMDDNGRARAGMGLDAVEYRPGQTGLAIGNFSFEGIAFYDLAASGRFSERAREVGVYAASYPYVTFGLFFADFDRDGQPDLFATNGHVEDTIERTNPGQTYAQPSLVYHNQGGRLADASREAGPGVREPLLGRGACRGDYDNDGRPDILLIPNTGAPRLLHNETKGGHWIAFRLEGAAPNRDGLGASVAVESARGRQSLYHSGASSYLSASDPRVHFGLGNDTAAARVTVKWPGGKLQTWQDLPADRIHELKQQ